MKVTTHIPSSTSLIPSFWPARTLEGVVKPNRSGRIFQSVGGGWVLVESLSTLEFCPPLKGAGLRRSP